MRCLVLGALALLVCLAALGAQNTPKDKSPPGKPVSPAEQYQALLQEFQKAEQEIGKAYREAKTDEERQKVLREKGPGLQKFPARFLELAQKNAKDPVAVEALIWVVTRTPVDHPVLGPIAQQAVDQLVQNHLASPKLGPLCAQLAQEPLKFSEKLLRGVLDKSPHRDVRGLAGFSLALAYKNLSEQEPLPQSKKAAEEAEKLFDEVIAKYGDVKIEKVTLGELAKPELFEVRHLAIGKVAPEIEGEDSAGKKFQLSEYRGKVVVLDFWARS